jgi:hypothetical protein
MFELAYMENFLINNKSFGEPFEWKLILFFLFFPSLALSGPYWMPDNTKKGDGTMKCEARVEKGTKEVIADLKRQYSFCREPRETLVKGNLVLPCKHPTNGFESKVFVVSESQAECEAQLQFNNTNEVPKGFENPNKLIIDKATNTTWRPFSDKLSWQNAIKKCQSLPGNWHLPTKEEFEKSLKTVTMIKEVKNQVSLAFWSSTPFEKDKKGGRVYVLYNGKMDLRDQEIEGEIIYPVLCVRKTN